MTTNIFDLFRCDASNAKVSNKSLIEALETSLINNPQLSVLDGSNFDEALDIFAEAFLDDPLFTWAAGLDNLDLDDQTKKERQFKVNRLLQDWENRPVFLRKRGIGIGVTSTSSERGEKEKASLAGVISIVPGQYNNSSILQIILNMIHIGPPPFYTKEKVKYGAGADKRLDSMLAANDLKKKWMVDTNCNYVYIASVGVLNKYRGKGFGGALLRAVLKATDSLNVPTCLVTESKKNESMYHHFGFETMEVLDLEAEGTKTKLPIYWMIRQPPGNGQGATKE